MTTLDLTTDQRARLLVAVRGDRGRRAGKRLLHDLGGDGSAAELDACLAAAEADDAARRQAARVDAAALERLQTVALASETGAARMIHELDHAAQAAGVTRHELAGRVGAKPPAITMWLNGDREPGLTSLAELAAALGKRWTLVDA